MAENTYSDFMDRLAKQFAEQIDNAREAQAKAIARLRETLEGFAPQMGPISVPFADFFPSPKAIAQANFSFFERLLRAQRDYALGLIDAFRPVDGDAKSKAKAA